MSQETKSSVPNAAPNWQANLTHPHLNARVSLQPTREGVADGTPQHVQLSLEVSSNHPIIQQILQELGPLIAQMLPILIVSLLGSGAQTTPSST